MKLIKLSILIIIIHSCQIKEKSDVWINKNAESNFFELLEIKEDSISHKFLSSMNYWILNNKLTLPILSDNFYSNDSLHLELIDSAGLYAKYYKNNVLLNTRLLNQMPKFDLSSQLNNFKLKIKNKKLILYKSTGVDSIDIIDENYSYSINEDQNIENYDVFSFGGELFLITNTSFFYPIHIKEINEKSVVGIMHTFDEEINVKIAVQEIPILSQKYQGKWVYVSENSKSDKPNYKIELTSDKLIEYRGEKIDTQKINTLSCDGTIAIIDSNFKYRPFVLELKKISKDSLEIVNSRKNYRNNKSNKYIKEKGSI